MKIGKNSLEIERLFEPHLVLQWGLGTQSRHEAPGDLRVEVIKTVWWHLGSDSPLNNGPKLALGQPNKQLKKSLTTDFLIRNFLKPMKHSCFKDYEKLNHLQDASLKPFVKELTRDGQLPS